MWRNALRPGAYHGPLHGNGPYFEGWYYKLVAPNGTQRMAIIPGVFLGVKGVDSHAFVQTLDGHSGRTTYHRFPIEAFQAHPTEFALQIGPNHFNHREIVLDLDGTQRVKGVVRFDNVAAWPVSLRSPGIMGWYAYIPFMECLHGVLGFDPTLSGMLVVDDAVADFHGGRGYMEKDWGQAFPRAWIWMQCNHFDQTDGIGKRATSVSLTASVARIPWLGSAFRGFIVGLWIDGALYRFATYTGATIERLAVTQHEVIWTLRGPQSPNLLHQSMRLEIIAQRSDENADLLHAPYRTAMLQRVLESLTATVSVRLTTNEGQVLFAGAGQYAGLELGGELSHIL
jgi:hypothetical protein